MELFQNTLQLGVKRPVRYGMLKPIPKEALESAIWIHVDSKFTIALPPAQYNILPSPAEILRMIGHAWIPKSQTGIPPSSLPWVTNVEGPQAPRPG